MKNPPVPPGPLHVGEDDLIRVRPRLVRIHSTAGRHPSPWNALREWGPVDSCRWDPHPLPAGLHAGNGVSYAATDLKTAVAERFQATRRVEFGVGEPYLTFWKPTRELALLDLANESGADWLIRQGASYSLQHAPRATCRAWARAIRDAASRIDGLWVQSTMTGNPVVVLWDPSRDSFPTFPEATAPLSASRVRAAVRQAVVELGFR